MKKIFILFLFSFLLSSVYGIEPKKSGDSESGYHDTIIIKTALDTVPLKDRMIVLFEQNRWYYLDEIVSGKFYIDTLSPLRDTLGIFAEHWSNDTVHYEYVDLVEIDNPDTLLLVDKEHPLFSLPKNDKVTYKFDFMRWMFHYGVDQKAETGDAIRACFDGKVRFAKYNWGGYGNLVIIRHHNGLETVYAHLSKIHVKENELVRAGKVIGEAGNTGRSTGTHLHFEVRYHSNALDPERVFDFEGRQLVSDTLVINSDVFAYKVEMRKRVYHTIRPGDTLGALALAYHTTVTNICQLNGIYSTTLLQVGRSLRVR